MQLSREGFGVTLNLVTEVILSSEVEKWKLSIGR